jgi:hypothetical protein
MILPDKPMLTDDDLTHTLLGFVGMMQRGISHDSFVKYLGVEPEALAKVAEDAADEEFDPRGGRLRKLSAQQRRDVHEALVETFAVAYKAGAVNAYVRAGVGIDGL